VTGDDGRDAVLRHPAFVAVALLVAMTLGMGAAQGKKKRRKPVPPPPPADLPGHVNYLARRLFGVPLDESEPLTSQIQKLVFDDLEGWMNKTSISSPPSDPPLDVKVRTELEFAFSKLHYPLMGQPAVFAQALKGSTLIGAGYTLGWTDYDRANAVALFEAREGKTRLAALTNFVPRTDLHYEILPSPQSDNFRFFIYGWRLGKSQPRLNATLYLFDGQSLKSLWETQDVYDGKIEFNKNRVVIRYLKEEEYTREVERKRKPPRHQATYKITPQGLELEADIEIPF